MPFVIGPAGRFEVPWQRSGAGLMPVTRSGGSALMAPSRPDYRLQRVEEPGVPVHYHVIWRTPPYTLRLQQFEQATTASVPRGLFRCQDVDCDWFLNGHEGIDEGLPFRHPAGVECGDERGCTDPNCPCPQRVVEWPDGVASGHVRPCQFCGGRYRYHLAGAAANRAVGFDEYFQRTGEGALSLIHILTRGL